MTQDPVSGTVQTAAAGDGDAHYSDGHFECYFAGSLSEESYRKTVDHLSSCGLCRGRAVDIFERGKKDGLFKGGGSGRPRKTRARRVAEAPALGWAIALVCIAVLIARSQFSPRAIESGSFVAATSLPALRALSEVTVDIQAPDASRGGGIPKAGKIWLESADRTAVATLRPTLDWSEPAAPKGERYRLSIVDGQGRAVYETDRARPPFTVPVELSPGKAFAWRVYRFDRDSIVVSEVGRFQILDSSGLATVARLGSLAPDERLKQEMALGLLDDAAADLGRLHFPDPGARRAIQKAIEAARSAN